MNDKDYLAKIGSHFHRFSKAITAKGQEFLDQAPARSGHNVSYTEVRAEVIPPVLNIAERNLKLLENYGSSTIPKYKVNNAYKHMMKFYQKVSLTEIPNTNGESWRLLDENGIPVSELISPTDVLVDGKYLSDGYAITLYNEAGEKISQNYGREFEYYSGILTFHSDATPSKKNWGTPKIDAFQYIGKYAKDYFEELQQLIEDTKNYLDQVKNESIAVQRYKFSTDSMEIISEPEVLPKSFGKDGQILYVCNFKMIIPGYNFETISLDQNDVIITDILHDENTGDSIIILQLVVDKDTKLPIIGWYGLGEDGLAPYKPITGKQEFLATTFIRNDGRKIEILPLKEL